MSDKPEDPVNKAFINNEFVRAFLWSPEPKGYYVLGTAPGAFQIALYYKPHFIHRFFVKVCLGFVWRDNG